MLAGLAPHRPHTGPTRPDTVSDELDSTAQHREGLGGAEHHFSSKEHRFIQKTTSTLLLKLAFWFLELPSASKSTGIFVFYSLYDLKNHSEFQSDPFSVHFFNKTECRCRQPHPAGRLATLLLQLRVSRSIIA